MFGLIKMTGQVFMVAVAYYAGTIAAAIVVSKVMDATGVLNTNNDSKVA